MLSSIFTKALKPQGNKPQGINELLPYFTLGLGDFPSTKYTFCQTGVWGQDVFMVSSNHNLWFQWYFPWCLVTYKCCILWVSLRKSFFCTFVLDRDALIWTRQQSLCRQPLLSILFLMISLYWSWQWGSQMHLFFIVKQDSLFCIVTLIKST